MLSNIIKLTTPPYDLFNMITSKLRGRQRKIQKQAKPSLWILANFNYSLACSEMFEKDFCLPLFLFPTFGHVCFDTEIQFFTRRIFSMTQSLNIMHKLKENTEIVCSYSQGPGGNGKRLWAFSLEILKTYLNAFL